LSALSILAESPLVDDRWYRAEPRLAMTATRAATMISFAGFISTLCR